MSIIKVYGQEGISQPEYTYISCSQQSVVAEELKGNPVVVDTKSQWTHFTQFDIISKRVVGPVKSICVFVEGSEFKEHFKPYHEYVKGRSGVYWYPKYLGKLLKQTYMPDVIFLEGSSTRGIKNSDDKYNEVARKVLKRIILKSKVKAAIVKVASRIIPLALSTAALSL